MDKDLVKVALRCKALYLVPEKPKAEPVDPECPDMLTASTLYTLEQMLHCGYTVDEKALRMLNHLCAEEQADILEAMHEVYGVDLNWMPLVKDWQEPVKADWATNRYVGFYNIVCDMLDVKDVPGDRLPCGHLIPPGTFEMDRYNGCPLCGTPFRTADFVIHNPHTNLNVLKGWGNAELHKYFVDLLESKVPLDATSRDSLSTLLDYYDVPEGTEITIRETAAEVTKAYIELGELENAYKYVKTPADVLRVLCYCQTGKVQVMKPRTLIKAAYNNGSNMLSLMSESDEYAADEAAMLRLKYSRTICRLIARLLNGLEMDAAAACETMNPNRGMWVRYIRALRLAEYARKKGFEHLREILDRFYRKDYDVLQGEIDEAMAGKKYLTAVNLLSRRPGLFARQLFNLMLTTNQSEVISHFRKVADKLPLRLLYSLGNNAEQYFLNKTDRREVRVITGTVVNIPANPWLKRYDHDKLVEMVKEVTSLVLDNLRAVYAKNPEPGRTIYIDPALYRVPLPVGDRSATVAGAMWVPQGTAFPLKSDTVRVFLQWGKGLKAQHLDLDLSAVAVYTDKTEVCTYFNLTATGLQHSGDIQHIPDDVGAAEYIEAKVKALAEAGAKYVAFTMNAYSNGAIVPNTMAGWMNSEYEMKVDNETGVAYDPANVDYLIKIDDNNLSKGLAFAVLDVENREMIWLEMAFGGQTINGLDYTSVKGLLRRLSYKVSIGQALTVMADAREMEFVGKEEITADTKVYTRDWAYDAAAVARELL